MRTGNLPNGAYEKKRALDTARYQLYIVDDGGWAKLLAYYIAYAYAYLHREFVLVGQLSSGVDVVIDVVGWSCDDLTRKTC